MSENFVWNFYFVYVEEYKRGISINPLKPSGYYMYHLL
jgi:hypothetical protein